MKPSYVIRINQQAIAKIIGLDCKVETDFPLFEQRLARIEPLQPPLAKFFQFLIGIVADNKKKKLGEKDVLESKNDRCTLKKKYLIWD